ncbi:MAG: hypothetical protein N2490_01915 [Ignavibacteria bacterium]|nr:hypothetical protein [Ignavibacteria bacterium]
METQILQPVEVIAYFHNLKLEIIKFKWKNTIYNVSQLVSKWKVLSGNNFEYHFTVICKEQGVICELSYNLNDFKWELVQLDNLE